MTNATTIVSKQCREPHLIVKHNPTQVMASRPVYNSVRDYDCKRSHQGDLEYARAMPYHPCFISYDPSFKTLIGDSAKITLVEQRADKFAHEAGVYIKSTNKNYFTSNYQSGKSIETYAVDCTTFEITEDKFDKVVTANGACHYNDKVLYCCQGDFNTPSALVLVDPATGKSEIMLNNLYGREFNSINDVVIHHARDEIWFTDPTYGWEQAFRPSPMLPSQVYRFKPSTGQIWCVADGFVQCNGLCFSPDYKRMYITDTGALQAHGAAPNGSNISINYRCPATIYSFDVVENGARLANRQMFAYTDAGIPDGIKCDTAGNVYSGCGDGVHVWDPTGTLLGKIYTGGVVANFNFTKDGMWMMAEEKLFFCELAADGALVEIECL